MSLTTFFLMVRPPPSSSLFPYTTLFRSVTIGGTGFSAVPTVDFTGSAGAFLVSHTATALVVHVPVDGLVGPLTDRKSTRLNSSHVKISYAVLCLKKETGTYLAGDTVMGS